MTLFDNASEFFQDLGTSWRAFRELRNVARRDAGGDRQLAARIEDAAILKQSNKPGLSSRLKVHTQDDQMLGTMFYMISSFSGVTQDIPRRGTRAYAEWLDNIWKKEPILAGAVYSMEAKMEAMTWRVEGGKINSRRTAEMLSRARFMTGNGWSGFIASSAIDFYVQDGGVFWDVTRRGSSKYGQISDLATIDSRNCVMTGNSSQPMYYYSSMVSDDHWYKPWEFIHFCSMPSPDERDLGMGFCAVSRAARAAKLLMALHDYDEQKMSNLPPEGIASVSGLTEREFRQAILLWQSERKKNNSLTFPQVLWLIGSTPQTKVSVDLTAFSSLPESFDRKTVVSQYVNTLALCFGVDTREFWAISTGALGTAAEAEVQHMKARGKGGGEFIAYVERHLNYELPSDVKFYFDTRDIEEDMINAEVAKQWIDAYLQLIYPPNPEFEPIIDAKTFKRLMADADILPEWAVGDQRVAISSDEVGAVQKEVLEDFVRFAWIGGKLQETLYIPREAMSFGKIDVPVTKEADINVIDGAATIVPEEPKANIIGPPIPEHEVERGARVTNTAIRNELEYWLTIPELAPHVPEEMLGG